MSLSYISTQVAVLDDFLPQPLYERLRHHFSRQEFQLVHNKKWQKVWRLSDGCPLVGPSCAVDLPPTPNNGQSDDPMQELLERLALELPNIETVLGASDTFSRIIASAWIYPTGTGLSLHVDGNKLLAGAFTYFVHDRWNIHWGGHLVVLDPSTPHSFAMNSSEIGTSGRWITDEIEASSVWYPGLAQCIFPKPNRLVFIGPAAQHLVTRVDPAAGQNARLSIAGFLIKKQTGELPAELAP